MTILTWEKPKPVMPLDVWRQISAEGAPPGVYTPNMSDADMAKWKAKKVGSRVEIRKTAGSQMLVKVTLETVTISMNGPAVLTHREMSEFRSAIHEARAALAEALETRVFRALDHAKENGYEQFLILDAGEVAEDLAEYDSNLEGEDTAELAQLVTAWRQARGVTECEP